MRTIETELADIIRAIRIVSPAMFCFAGRSIVVPVDSESAAVEQGRPLVEALWRQLYLHAYCRPFDPLSEEKSFEAAPDPAFIDRLDESNLSRNREDRGWRVLRALPGSHYFAEKNGSVRIFQASEFIAENDPGLLGEGSIVAIKWPRDSRTMHRGHYYVFGEAVADQQEDTGLLRLYWNLEAAGASALTRKLTERLNHFAIPFRFKLVNGPAGYDRSDAAVLYVNQRYYRVTAEVVREAYQEIRPFLKSPTPLFTRHLGNGLGFGEQPPNSESFGQHRCRLLAQAIWQSWRDDRGETQERVSRVLELFATGGVSLSTPWLNPGSMDDYPFETLD